MYPQWKTLQRYRLIIVITIGERKKFCGGKISKEKSVGKSLSILFERVSSIFIRHLVRTCLFVCVCMCQAFLFYLWVEGFSFSTKYNWYIYIEWAFTSNYRTLLLLFLHLLLWSILLTECTQKQFKVSLHSKTYLHRNCSSQTSDSWTRITKWSFVNAFHHV